MASPFLTNEICSLPAAGVQPASINFNSVTMDADNYILVRETSPQNSIVIVDVSNPADVQRRNMSADSAIMNPTSKVLALRAAVQDPANAAVTLTNLQVYNLETKAKVKACVVNEPVQYWRWINDKAIGLVTATSVFHWDMDGDAAALPTKIFDRAPNLASTQIISYKVDDAGKWAVLIGIAPGPPEKPALIQGKMQLYSMERQQSQPLDASAAAFATMKLAGRDAPSTLIAFAQKMLVNGQVVSKVHVIEVGGAPGQQIKKNVDLFFPPEFADDVPIQLIISQKYRLIYVVTRLGLLFVYDLETTAPVFRNRISQEAVFLASPSPRTGGLYIVGRPGGAVSRVTVNEDAIVGFIANQLRNVELAISLARRAGLPGAEALMQAQFDQLYAEGKTKEAAELAAEAPALRTPATLEKLRLVTPLAGQPSPLLAYFQILLSKGGLNAPESLELGRLVINSGKKHLLANWFNEGKLEASEGLGDLAMGAGEYDMALDMFKKTGVTHKVAQCLAAKGDFEALVSYCRAHAYTPDYSRMLQELLASNPSGAANLAKMLASLTPPPMPVQAMADLFFQRNMVKEGTAFLLDALKEDRPEDAPLQTMLIEVNIVTNPQMADSILKANQFTHYDRPRIAQRCENAGLYLHALEHYTELNDIKRCVVNTHAIEPQSLVEYFGNLSPEWALDCVKELMSTNAVTNLPIVVEVCRSYVEHLKIERIIKLLEGFKSYEGIFMFLGSQIAFTQEPDVVYKYIEAAAKTMQFAEVERITRESEVYDPERVKALLTQLRLADARPLINVCDRFDSADKEDPRYKMIYDMTQFFWQNGMSRYIEGYVQKINPAKAGKVVGALLDVDAPADFITNLIISVRSLIPVDEVVTEFEERGKLKLLNRFLEYLINENSTNPHVHNALAMILIDTNNNPEHFLKTNEYYEPLRVGKYAEKKDPTLACVAYRKGQCDDALVECTNKHALYKIQARYVVERSEPELWARVLDPENPVRRNLIDQVVAHALPECKNPEHVSAAVRAFMAADIPNELIELLEKIVLHNSTFAQNENLQNLLIITAIKADPSRVMDYINRLDKFDGPAVGEIAVQAELFEEAFAIYRKFDLKVLAIRVLLDHLNNLERAQEYASKIDEAEVWTVLGEGQLARGMVKDAIESFIIAEDGSHFADVIAPAIEQGLIEDLIKYLLMARRSIKDTRIDTDLLYCYARVNRLSDLESMIAHPHAANLQQAGDRCFVEGYYDAARIIFTAIPNWHKLASTLVKLHQFQGAVDAARKANSAKCWKEVCFACLDEGEVRLAQLCALNIIVTQDDLDDVVYEYRLRKRIEELIALLESGIGLDKAHTGIFTELAILYAEDRPLEKLMEHIKLFSTRINIPKLISVCKSKAETDPEKSGLWKALVFLYSAYDEHDSALKVMMDHPAEAWEHGTFKDVATKVANLDLFYKAVVFYLDNHPDLVNDLLRVLEPRIDNGRVVDLLRKRGQLPLIKDYLLSVQKVNQAPVNEALNDLFIEEGDHVGLKESISTHDNFDQLTLAARLEKHETLAFRRLAILLYKKNNRWRQAVDLAKRDKLYRDAMETASQSGMREIVEDLLKYFVDDNNRECFAACLYTCFDLVKPDVALELAWQAQMMDMVMPFLISTLRETTKKIDTLMEERKQRMEQDVVAETEKKKLEAMGVLPGMPNPYANMPLALPAPSMSAAPAALVSQGPVLPPAMVNGAQQMLMLTSGMPAQGAPGWQ